MDFKELASKLNPHIDHIIIDLVPGGSRSGAEYRASSIRGGPGKSFSINMNTGMWADFATGEKGGDIISLAAAVWSVNQADAAKRLSEDYLGLTEKPKHKYPDSVAIQNKPTIIKPPPNAEPPGFRHSKFGDPTQTWVYRDRDGSTLFHIARYENAGKKEFMPFTFQSNGRWANKAWPTPRPLYNLDKIAANPNKPILICEGEKAADAAETLTTAYITTTWPNGASSLSKVDFSPIYNRNVLLWPDGDEVGEKCMGQLAVMLVNHCEVVKYIETDHNSGWDAADAAEMPDFRFHEWAKPLVKTVAKPVMAEVMEPAEDPESAPVSKNLAILYNDLCLDRTHDNTRVVMNSKNVSRILSAMPEYKGKIWYDSFEQKIFTTIWSSEPEIWSDFFDIRIFEAMVEKYKLIRIAKTHIMDAIYATADRNRKNEPQSWLKSLNWDGHPRVRDFFHRAMQAEDNEYTQAISHNFFVAMVARIMNPGCKHDAMVILEGGQGTFKSTSLEILAGKYFAEAPSNLDNKDFEQSMVGKIILEFGELDQFRKAETTLIKKKLSCRIDNYRPSYGRHVIEVPRTCVFVGTTNKHTYLQDETGGRRFWPIRVNICDINYISDNREQFFAEAMSLYLAGATWHEVPDSAKDEQDARREEHPWEPLIQAWLDAHPYAVGLTSHQIYLDCIQGPVERFDSRAKNGIAKVMTTLGYRIQVSKTGDRKSFRQWVKPGAYEQSLIGGIEPKKPYNHAPGADNSEHH